MGLFFIVFIYELLLNCSVYESAMKVGGDCI